MENKNKTFIINLLHQLIKPAMGCTEIGAVALATAASSKHLKKPIKKIYVNLSQFIYRNIVSVGVPLLGKIGTEGIAIAGSVIKNIDKKLNIISELKTNEIKQIKSLMKKNIVKVNVLTNVDPIYVEARIKDVKNNVAVSLIKHAHDNIEWVKLNDSIVYVPDKQKSSKYQLGSTHLSIDYFKLIDIYNCIKSLTIKDLSFLKDGIDMNNKIKEQGYKHPYAFTKAIKGTDWKQYVIKEVTSAIEARMAGCKLPVMSSCDSGDHGLTVSIPQYAYAKFNKINELKLLQALAFSHIITWIIKKHIGSLSAYCGSVIAAATATTVGIAYQRNCSIKQINNLINLCIASNGGAICDGAKMSCAFKVLAALNANFHSLELVENNAYITNNEGIINNDALTTIKDLGNISKTIMDQTNDVVTKTVDKNHQQLKNV